MARDDESVWWSSSSLVIVGDGEPKQNTPKNTPETSALKSREVCMGASESRNPNIKTHTHRKKKKVQLTFSIGDATNTNTAAAG